MRHSGLAVIAALGLAIAGPAAADTAFKTIAHFPGGNRGYQPEAGVLVDPIDGRTLYGTTDEGGKAGTNSGVVFKLMPPATAGGAWTEQVLDSLPGSAGGGYPLQLLADGTGGLFGYTLDGGAPGFGTVFQAVPKANPASVPWKFTQLYAFSFGTDGAYPSGLVRSGKRLFGVTDQGGGGTCESPFGDLTYCGTVFQMLPPKTAGGPWTEQVLYAFQGGTDGATPSGHLLLSGNPISVLGTTGGGGGGSCTYNDENIGCGVVYRMTPPARSGGAWTQQVVYTFQGGSDGSVPVDGVIPDGAGGFFGVTAGGGVAGFGGFGLGTIYRLVKAAGGWTHRVIYRFQGELDGYEPQAGLYYNAATKALYGTTYLGGASFGGTVFRLDHMQNGRWNKNILHSFNGDGDGSYPTGRVVKDSTGAFYGTTLMGQKGGTVYQLTVTE